MKRVKKFIQIAPVVVNDGLRNITHLFALDATGALWADYADGSGFVRVEQPESTTADLAYARTKGL